MPDDWVSTRHCPTCGAVELAISAEEDGSVLTSCLNCGRLLQKFDLDDDLVFEDEAWRACGEH